MIFNGIDIEIERKPIKNLHLAVYPPDGRVHISVPIDYDDERIRMYILQKWIWIEEKREIFYHTIDYRNDNIYQAKHTISKERNIG